MRKLVLSLLCITVAALLGVGHARAEGNTITISPAQVDIELATTDAQKNASFTVTNTYNVPVELSVELKGINQEAGLIIPSDEVDPMLADSVKLSQTLIAIPEQSTATVSMVVTNGKALSAGGHYGTIVFTQRKSADSQVNFTQAISAGLFVVKRGGQLREVDATSFSYKRLPFQIPSSASVTIKNIGNVHVIPRYAVLIYGKDNLLVAKGVGDIDSRRILPDKELDEKVVIKQSKALWLPQRLKVVLEYRSDGIEESKQIVKTMLYIPPYIVPLMIVVLGCITLLVRRSWRRRTRKSHIESFAAEPHRVDEPQVPIAEPSSSPITAKKKKTKKSSKKAKKISVESLEP